MRLAVWNIPPLVELFATSAAAGAEISFGSPEECKKLLLDGYVDVAMMGINEVLRNVDAFTIFPELVLATKSSRSFAGLRLNVPLNEVRIVDALPEHRQAGEVAEILLREHYQLDVEARYRSPIGTNGESPDAWVEFEENRPLEPGVASGSAEARLGSGSRGGDRTAMLKQGQHDVGDDATPFLDIGQEWFEMIAHPLVWGVFVMRGGFDPADYGGQLLELASFENVASEGILLRFDPEVLAGLDELAHYLFYFGKVDDIPMPRFSRAPGSIRPPE